jgi:hypothetical protein
MQESIHPEIGKSTLNSAQEKERPDNESSKYIIINRETNYHLMNGRFSRQLSQDKIISEIL